MKKTLFIFFTLLSPIILICQDSKKVLLIGIDGCRPDALQIANTPNIDNLIADGIFAPDALNDDITVTGPGWSAVFCGVWSDKHLVIDNSFDNNNYEVYPAFYKYVEDFDATLHTVSIADWLPINDFIIQDYADYKMTVSNNLEVANQGSSYISLNDPDVIFLYFDEVDDAGHDFGFSPTVPEYIAAIEGVDSYIGTIIQSLVNRPTYADEDWLIVTTTDHGGLGTEHGGNSLEEENVFIIVNGNNVVPDTIFRDSSTVLNPFINCLDDSTELNFDGINDYVSIPSNSIFNFNDNQDFTIECRVRTSISGDVAIVGNKDWDSGYNKGFVFSFKYPAGPEWKVNIADSVNRADINTGGEIADNEWYTLSVSFDRDGWMKMYQDGVLLDSANISSVGDINTNEGLYFGADIFNNYAFSGAIGEVRVWNTIVDAQEIGNWHCTSVDNSHPDINQLIGHWKLNEGFGTNEAIDYSPNGNNGDFVGVSWLASDSIVVYDYSSTLRLTDVAPTVFNHLCIPIEDSWGLEGTSIIQECDVSNIEKQNQLYSTPELHVFPNPANSEVYISLKNYQINRPIKLEVYHSIGTKIFEQDIQSNDFNLDISQLKEGVYFFSVRFENKKFATQKLIRI